VDQDKEVRIVDICAYSKVDERILKNLYRKENLCDSFKRELKMKRQILSDWIDGKDDLYDTDRIIAEREAKRNQAVSLSISN